MQDRSGSMLCPAADEMCQNATVQMAPTRWDAMTAAVTTFVNSPDATSAHIAVGLGLFPHQEPSLLCTPTAYGMPIVPIAPLPGNAMPIVAAIAASTPGGGTPTVPALQGAINYARIYTMQSMSARTAAVLLVTDGLPTGCTGNDVTAAANMASAGYMGTPQVKTFVVGLGNTAALDQVALAGSGGTTHYFPSMGDVTTTILRALNGISGMATCSYPVPAGGSFDPNLVNLVLKIGAAQQRVGRVDNAGACGAAGGWYYDSPSLPREILLCPAACDALKANPGSTVQIAYGCPSLPP
jgi:hypothetical protein